MQSTPIQVQASEQALFCRARSRLIAIPIARVVETMRPLPVEAVAGMPAFVMGLAIVRGAPVPVVDVTRLLADGHDEARIGRFVTLRVGERRVALAVEAVLGVGELLNDSLAPLPDLLGGADGDVVSAIGALDQALLVVLRAARLVPDGTWRVLDASGDPP